MRFVREGWKFAGVVLAVGFSAGVVVPPVGLAVVIAAGAILLFFRDPQRTPPAEGVVAPADGRVQLIRHDGERVLLGVFMNVTDVHVNRAPVEGGVVDVDHRPGGYWPAFSKASDRNERVEIALATDGGDVTVSLIAGTVARRITPYVDAGDWIRRGQRIGHIAFGSRVDVRFPPGVGLSDLRVARGDRVTAGETVIADWPETSSDEAEANG